MEFVTSENLVHFFHWNLLLVKELRLEMADEGKNGFRDLSDSELAA